MASDSDGDEDFVTYGTPLEPLEEDEPLRKPVPLHDQTVKDERGRYQRFHGAFTGGFSAGYFNTVGTKEGWAPSTFVSSRQQKAGRQDARPEDFMDEEDFGEHGIAPREITTSQEFSSGRRDAAAEKKRAVSAQAALIPGDTLLEELIAPARSSIGVELLRRMGWREGQGVGPRVKRRARRQQIDGVRGYGCVPPPAGSEESEDDDDEFAPENVTFAPKDVTPVDFSPKPGVQGLGYRGLDPGLALVGRGAPEHIDLFRPQSETRSHLIGDKRSGSRRGGVAGQAFGVGAMEDDDDEEVYHRDSMSRYDTVLGGEEPGDGLYGWTAPQQYTKKREKSKDASYLGKILEGFTLAQKPGEKKTIFPPPDLPRDYRPVHRFRPSVDVSVLSGVSPALAEALKNSKGRMVKEEPEQGGRHQLDSGQRGALLGEDALQGPSSVMELLRPADRHRLLSLRNSFHQASAPDSQDALRSMGSSGASPSSGPQQQQQQQEALAAWRGVQTSSQTFRPFEKNPSKQARYELYVNSLRQGDKGALDQSVDPAMTEWERSRERDEFIRSSILYRPSSTSLSSRFTRGKHEADEDTVEVSRDEEGDVDDKQAAVEMKLFGKLTRETFEWHPDKLLCKRFNVPDPFPGSGVLGLPKVKRDKFSVFNFLTVTDSRETAAPPPAPPPAPLPEPGRKSRWDVSEQKKKNDSLSELLSTARNQTEIKLEPTSPPAAPPAAPSASISSTEMQSEGQQSLDKKKEADEEEEEEEEEDSRPPMDLFKAIFASSSEEKSSSSSEGGSDDEEDEKKNKEEGKSDSQPPTLFNVTSSSITSSVTSSSVSSSAATCSRNIAVSCQTLPKQEEEEFGPKLPPPSAALTRGGAASARSPSDEEKPSKRSKEKKVKNKKQHKHKKEKKKKKHKKHKVKAKKKSKKEASDSSSGDSDEDGGLGHLSTDELLKRLKSVRSHQTW